jgi:hypothetical protein
MQTLFSLINSIQPRLLPFMEDNLAPLTDKEREFIKAAKLTSVSKPSGSIETTSMPVG